MRPVHLFLAQPAFGFCRGVLPYSLGLLLPFVFFANQCFAKGHEGFGCAFLVCPLLVMICEISFRRTRLPEPIAEAYDALIRDVRTEVVSQSYKQQAAAFFHQVAVFFSVVIERALVGFWFLVQLLRRLIDVPRHVLASCTRSACDAVSLRKVLLLTQVHTIRSPSVVLL